MKLDENIVSTILTMASERGSEKSTCPSEIARKLYPDRWRDHMKSIVEVAINLHHEGKIVITQNGMPINVRHIKGPIRIKII